jgi:hypothetical protein
MKFGRLCSWWAVYSAASSRILVCWPASGGSGSVLGELVVAAATAKVTANNAAANRKHISRNEL